MKFTDGYWTLKPEYTALYAVEATTSASTPRPAP